MRLTSLEKEINGKVKFMGKVGKTYFLLLKGKVIFYKESRRCDCILRKNNTVSYDVDVVQKVKELGAEFLVTWCSDTRDMFISPIDLIDDKDVYISDMGEDPQYRIPMRSPYTTQVISDKIKLGYTILKIRV